MDYWLTSGGGWDFDRYRADFSWDPEEARTTQTGRADLEPLRTATLDAWLAQALQVSRALDAVLGPAPRAPLSLDPEVLEERERDGYRERKVTYRAEEGERIPAYLLLPDRIIPSSHHRLIESTAPAVICLHQTVPWGKEEPCGLAAEGNPDLAYASELAQRGYVCLAPDAICFGERYRAGDPYSHYGDAVGFFGRHPEWSVMGKMAYDVGRAVDFLCSLPFVRSDAIGCIGHSHGAYGTLFAMLHEPRITAGVVSCGFTSLRTDPNPERWWRRTALMPRLGWFEDDVAGTPFDFHHLLALVAPRGLFVSCALSDGIFPNTDNIGWIADEVSRVYALQGVEEAFACHMFEGDHRFPAEAREKAYRFLDERLS